MFVPFSLTIFLLNAIRAKEKAASRAIYNKD
jgi:hypothetical protein